MRALLEESLPCDEVVEAECGASTIIAADRNGDRLNLILLACDSEDVDVDEISEALAGVCPRVPILLWSNSLESADVRSALDAGVRGEVVKASDRAGLRAAIAAVVDSGGDTARQSAERTSPRAFAASWS